MIKTCNCEL